MKISKEIWIDDTVKWNPLRKRTLSKKNYYNGQAYMVCTSPRSTLLFEIIEARQLNSCYDECTLLAICKNKKQAVERVTVLIDLLYNQKNKTYDELLG